ncbi:hypothetical protein [Niveispirillum sp.]|uniref:hypothetical protein n=1 Tax=Niveispirillum sp. TaxID=1917217 RepID=UPI001B56C488|nr:hypothetical protein [Niveispirillum sp.]MBP7334387.1 hypothetical protein [Niveispirillum sp.]
MDNLFNRTGTKRGHGLRGSGFVMTARQIPLNQQTIFRTIEGRDELLHVVGQRPEILL